MYNKKYLAYVIAGGKGERLYPLTKERSKPSVPFGAKYRLIDFVLSNLINSGIYSIYVVVQYKSQSLIEHIRTGRRRSGLALNHFMTVVPAQMRTRDVSWYKGTADAIYQNINLILDAKPDIVAVFAADHIYRMDVMQMINFHLSNKADVTVATLPASEAETHKFGIAKVDKKGRIKGFVEKPSQPELLLKDSGGVCSSMGNYIFDAGVLVDILFKDARKKDSEHDFGKSIIPRLIKKSKVLSYSFKKNIVPGVNPHEERAYWRDVGNLESFVSANMDLLGDRPKMDLNNKEWPIMTADFDGPPSRMLGGEVINSIIGEGVVIDRASISHSVIGRGVIIEKGSTVEDSIIMGFSKIGKGCKIRKAVIDRFNAIQDGAIIGYDHKKEKKLYHVDPGSGIVVIPRGARELP